MTIQRIAAFSNGNSGGNPAGVYIGNRHPSETDMQRIAAEVGYSETAFAAPVADTTNNSYQVRYFAPETEVPFCGHATIALGAALALRHGDGTFPLILNDAEITVEGHRNGDIISAALLSPPTHSSPAPADLITNALSLFSYDSSQLNPDLPPALANGGANHLILCLNSSEALAAMTYDLNAGSQLMDQANIVTISLLYAETPQLFHARNPFAAGGVYEDPATGAAAAALGGYLRDIHWPHGGTIKIIQGEDMGMGSRLQADISPTPGSPIRVSGTARIM